MSHFKLYVKVLWFFLFTGHPLISVNAPSFLNLKNDKLSHKYSSRRGRSSHKTSMVFNDGSFLRMCGKFMPFIILFSYQLAGISRVRTTLGGS